jgi:hypothetical protein
MKNLPCSRIFKDYKFDNSATVNSQKDQRLHEIDLPI